MRFVERTQFPNFCCMCWRTTVRAQERLSIVVHLQLYFFQHKFSPVLFYLLENNYKSSREIPQSHLIFNCAEFSIFTFLLYLQDKNSKSSWKEFHMLDKNRKICRFLKTSMNKTEQNIFNIWNWVVKTVVYECSKPFCLTYKKIFFSCNS